MRQPTDMDVSTSSPPPPYVAPVAPSHANRPELPVRLAHRVANPLVYHYPFSPLSKRPLSKSMIEATFNDPDALVVKFQTIVRDGREIVVGRLKVATNMPPPYEHAFILRRYDTGAISVTTMFKAAFPGATDDEEEREMRWIKSMFDMTGMNGSRDSPTVKLAGHWIPPATATSLAGAYRMTNWIRAIVEASPETGVAYRKSQRSQHASDIAAQRSSRTAGSRRSGTTPDLATNPTAPAAKRVKRDRTEEANSPAPASTSVALAPAISTSVPAPVAVEAEAETVGVTISTTTEIRAPAGTVIDPEEQIAQSKADIMRLRAEAEARSAAGETPAEIGLVASDSADVIDAAQPAASSSTVLSRGQKRTAADQEAEESSVSLVGSSAALPGTTAARVIRGGRARIVQPDQARRNGAFTAAVMFGVGALGAWVAQNML